MLTLASDFGSPYPAAMRGVILAQTDDVEIIDIAHDFPRQNVRTAAFWLREILPWFPPAVHCAVIDPGVGTDRAVLAVDAGEHVLVGPDNGLLAPVARKLADDEPRWYRLQEPDARSSTFHGRDVFAPLAARLHGRRNESLKSESNLVEHASPVDLSFPTPTIDGDRIVGEVLVVDGFGNAITNIPGEHLDELMGREVRVNGESVPVGRSYASVEPGARLVTIGSHQNVELAVNRGRGDAAFDLTVGDRFSLEPGVDVVEEPFEESG
ncbi:MAG: S-adenosyl-l-methionine hydroxide adenosyltransferase family protein [Halobacteriaceae archaeon]